MSTENCKINRCFNRILKYVSVNDFWFYFKFVFLFNIEWIIIVIMCYKCFIIKIIFVFIGEKDFLFFLIVLVVCKKWEWCLCLNI